MIILTLTENLFLCFLMIRIVRITYELCVGPTVLFVLRVMNHLYRGGKLTKDLFVQIADTKHLFVLELFLTKLEHL